MADHTRTFSTATPNTDTGLVGDGAEDIRKYKVDFKERFTLDHYMDGVDTITSADADGYHRKVTMKPISSPTLVTGTGVTYVSSVDNGLYFKNADGDKRISAAPRKLVATCTLTSTYDEPTGYLPFTLTILSNDTTITESSGTLTWPAGNFKVGMILPSTIVRTGAYTPLTTMAKIFFREADYHYAVVANAPLSPYYLSYMPAWTTGDFISDVSYYHTTLAPLTTEFTIDFLLEIEEFA